MSCVSGVVRVGLAEATKRCSDTSALGQSAVTLAGAALILTIACLIARLFSLPGTEVGRHDPALLALLLFSGAISLGISQYLWIWSVGKIGVFLASVHMNAVPFYVMVIVALLLGGEWNWLQSAGVALVAAGVLITQLATSRRHGRLRV